MLLKDTPIQRKLMFIILLTCGVVLLLTCAGFIAYEMVTQRRGMVKDLTTRAQIIAANSTAALAFENADDADDVLAALKSDPRMVSAAIYGKDGALFATHPIGVAPETLPAPPGNGGHRFDSGHLVVAAPILQGERALGAVVLQSDLSELTDRYRAHALLALGILVGSVVVAALISKTLQKQISHPILALAETARSISERGDFSVRARKEGNDEIGLLTEAFNQMLAENHKLNSTLEHRVQERTAELQEANKELQAFSYSVSHDLRAPLRHVIGFVELLQKDVGPTLPEKNLRQLRTISKAAKRMGDMIDDLLAFSRLGKSEMRKSEVDLEQMVRETVADFQSETKARNIAWELAPMPKVWADGALLRLALINLVSNAVKFTGQRAEPKIQIGCAAGGENETVVFVRDNGAGFDPQYVHKLFGVFERLHKSEEFEGTGIGLANVQRIIRRHGGRAWAEGAVDQGATFYFSIPNRPPHGP